MGMAWQDWMLRIGGSVLGVMGLLCIVITAVGAAPHMPGMQYMDHSLFAPWRLALGGGIGVLWMGVAMAGWPVMRQPDRQLQIGLPLYAFCFILVTAGVMVALMR